MEEESITLGPAERRRLEVMSLLGAGRVTNDEAAELLGLSVRQVQRLNSAYRRRGVRALIHGNRGRRPVNALDVELTRRVVELAKDTYSGFNQHHLAEMLAEREGLFVSRPTLQRVLTAAGLSAPRTRRPPKHRQRRDRYAQEGMLLQIDASPHDWLEGRGPRLSLVGGIDDATNMVPWGVFRDQEDAEGYFQLMHQVVVRHGIPMAVYCDRHSIFHMTKDKELTLEEQLAGRRRPTQFGRLLDELGVEMILAHSPQAKGRVERLWGTFQDRLTSELRLARASTRMEAQEVLVDMLPRHNRRFIVPPLDPEPAWIPWPADRRLEEYFCFKYPRVVARDNTVRFEGYLLDIPPQPSGSLARARVEVQQRFDGNIDIYRKGTCLVTKLLDDPPDSYRVGAVSQAADEPPPLRIPKPRQVQPPTQPRKPGSDHPWRRPVKAQPPPSPQ